MTDPFELSRFIAAQEPIYAQALAEVRSGRKTSHWMWFVFPQIVGLGSSAMAQRYAISGADEARTYLAHPMLGHRLSECAEALLGVEGRSAFEIFGSPDDMKLKSSMTLFAEVSAPDSAFGKVLDRYYEGQKDPRTLELLRD